MSPNDPRHAAHGGRRVRARVEPGGRCGAERGKCGAIVDGLTVADGAEMNGHSRGACGGRDEEETG